MTPVIKWVFVLVLATITAVTLLTVLNNHMKELEWIPEDEKLTEITSASLLMLNSVSVRRNI